MTTISQTIPSLGSPPLTSDPSNFDTRADTLYGTSLPAVITAVNTWAGQANTVAGEVNQNKIDAEAAQTAAEAAETAAQLAETNAEAAQAAAEAASNAVKWISGETIAEGENRYSPITFFTYRANKAISSGDNTTDPSADPADWVPLTSSPSVIQIVNTQTGALATGTTIMPLDDTIPQNTEGDQYMSLSITPTSATNKLLIEVSFMGSSSAGRGICAALFQDSTANALAATSNAAAAFSTNSSFVCFSHTMDAGTASATTFKVRIGPEGAATFYFNGSANGAARRYGGAAASSITITEYTP